LLKRERGRMLCFCFSCGKGCGEEEEVWFDANEVFVEEKEERFGGEEAPAAFASFSSSLSSSSSSSRKKNAAKRSEETWVHRPLRLENALSSRSIEKEEEEEEEQLPINDTRGFEIRTNAFEGKILVRCRDVRSRDEEGKEMTEKYFANKKRTFQTVVQGRFLRKGIKCSEVVTGHEFESRFRRIPARWLVSTALKVIRKLMPGLEVDLISDKPYIHAPLCATAQILRADVPGEEPDLTTTTSFAENTRLFGKAFDIGSSGGILSKQRKRLFNSPEFGSKYEFLPELVYTFDFYQHIFIPATFGLHIGPMLNVNLLGHLPEFEPPQIMAKIIREKRENAENDDGEEEEGKEEYLYKINMYHEKMFDAKFARASSPDVLFGIGARHSSYVDSFAVRLSEFVSHNNSNNNNK